MRTHEIKILLMDSDQTIRQGLRQLVATLPDLSVVGEAFSSESAMEQIGTAAPHLALLDFDLPGDARLG